MPAPRHRRRKQDGEQTRANRFSHDAILSNHEPRLEPSHLTRSRQLSGLHVDEDVLLALLRRLDLDDVDILAALFLNRHVGDFAGDVFKRNLLRLFFRDLCRRPRTLFRRARLLRLHGGHGWRKEEGWRAGMRGSILVHGGILS